MLPSLHALVGQSLRDCLSMRSHEDRIPNGREIGVTIRHALSTHATGMALVLQQAGRGHPPELQVAMAGALMALLIERIRVPTDEISALCDSVRDLILASRKHEAAAPADPVESFLSALFGGATVTRVATEELPPEEEEEEDDPFVAGDIVVCLDPDGGDDVEAELTPGKAYRIERICEGGCLVIVDDEGDSMHVEPSLFAPLVVPPELIASL